MLQRYALLLTLILATCHCGQGQLPASTGHQDAAPAAPVAHPTIVRTQTTDPYSNVCCGMRDRAGNLWFGTTGEGVYRFDGEGFTHLTTQDGLCDNTVSCMVEDAAGNIWMGTDDGICRYSPAATLGSGAGSFTPFTIPVTGTDHFPNGNPYAIPVYSMLQDKTGTIWLGTASGVYRYDGGWEGIAHTLGNGRQQTATDVQAASNSFTRFLASEVVLCMLEDRRGDLWAGSWTGWGAYRYARGQAGHACVQNSCRHDLHRQRDLLRHQQKIAASSTHFTRQNGIQDGMISDMVEDAAGNILFATRDHGIWRYDPVAASRGMQPFTHFSAAIGLRDTDVRCLLQDKAGNLWIGTDSGGDEEGQGMYRYDGTSITHFTTQDGLSDNDVFTLLEDNAGHIWVGTRNMGLCRYDGQAFVDFSGR